MRLIDAENFEAFDSTLPIQIAPKGVHARKIASFFYAEGCKRVLESIDAASTIDPESLRPTSYWQGEYDGYANRNPVYDVWHCSSCAAVRAILWQKSRVICSIVNKVIARMEDPDHD